MAYYTPVPTGTWGTDGPDYINRYYSSVGLRIESFGGDDTVAGGAGNDTIYLGSGNDLAISYGGNDYVDGGIGNDTVSGGWGNDTLQGGAGEDVLNGQGDRDVIYGGSGRDKITGGAHQDILTGGSDADVFIYNLGDSYMSPPSPYSAQLTFDSIVDFNGAEGDRIDSVGPSGAGGRYWELQVSPDKSYYDMVNLGDTFSLPRESVFVSNGTDGVLLLDMDWDGDRETHIGMQGVTLAEFESSFII